MKSFAERHAALAAKHTADSAALLAEERIISTLPEALRELEFSYHHYALYGTVGSLTVRHDRFDYSGKKAQPTLETVRALAEAYPAVEPLIKVKDGSCSFRAASHVAALPESRKERWESEEVCAPFLIKVSAFQAQTYTIEWTARIAGDLVRISVELPLPYGSENTIGRFDIVYRDYKGGRTLERCNFCPADNLITLFKGDEPVAQRASPIKWGRGSDDTPNDFTIYWEPLRDWEDGPDYRPSVLDLVQALTPVAVKV